MKRHVSINHVKSVCNKPAMRHLNDQGILTATNKQWKGESVRRILTNEKYVGDVLLQKTYKRSYLEKRSYANTGEKPQVLIENNHEAIIDRATFAKAKELISKRASKRHNGTFRSPFIGKIICGECGELFGHKTWNSRGNIRYSMWTCNHKYSEETTYGGKKCKTANLRQEWIEQGFLHILNQLLADKAYYEAKYQRKLARIKHQLESGKIEEELKEITKQISNVNDRRKTLEHEMEFTFGGNEEFTRRQAVLREELQDKLAIKKTLENERDSLRIEQIALQSFTSAFQPLPDKLTKFSGKTFTDTVDHIVVNQKYLIFHLYGDECIKVPIENLKFACL